MLNFFHDLQINVLDTKLEKQLVLLASTFLQFDKANLVQRVACLRRE